ncbi:hypothetical protein SAMN05443575_0803 [Jatrophihabitans endophyticus]|uniref:Sodium:proton antiporter n=1 Tax=Jatrophihabitans endophyticus TaxID=1206085 RepID=A0A1M5E6F3_9ACTN|nr:DUF6328 family protein [Jatrophihabitans endophyticus]SHF74843.1 hypothetical protein SAMN05443575_0803 [Jatrophihabitans endophyticus]
MTHRGYERDESAAHRFDRNYAELLQELRVAQTGVQILFAFLLGIAFQQRFTTLSDAERTRYVVTLASAAFAAVLLIAPVAAHRVLFARHRKDELVMITGRLAVAGLAFLGIAIVCAVLLITTVVVGIGWGIGITGALGLVTVVTWVVMPAAVVRRPDTDDDPARGRSRPGQHH